MVGAGTAVDRCKWIYRITRVHMHVETFTMGTKTYAIVSSLEVMADQIIQLITELSR